MANAQLSPQARAMNFGYYTRQHIQTLGAMTGTAGSHLEFEVPKARLLQAINLEVEYTLKAKKEGESINIYTGDDLNKKLALYDVLKRISINFNNGFQNMTASGKEFAILNMLRVKSDTIIPAGYEHEGKMCYFGIGDGETASELTVNFMLEIPITLNDRDPAGLVLAQNATTLINGQIDIANDLAIKSLENAYIDSVIIKPQIVSFSIPDMPEAFPDLTVLKIVDSRKSGFNAGGSNVISIPTGQIYRKIIIKLEDEEGNPILPEDITSNFELIFNGADTPYAISPRALRFRSVTQTGGCMPEGYYVFDFSCQGTNPNYGGSRDYVDSEQLTVFEARFTCRKAGKVTIISEKISRLKASN